MSQFAELLRVIGRLPDEPCTVLVKAENGPMVPHWTTVQEAPGVAEAQSGLGNIYFGVQPVARSSGRGKANDVTGLVTLYVDLDLKRPGKPDGLEFPEVAALLRSLSSTLGVDAPSAVVDSGNGRHGYWPVERMDPLSGASLLLWWREQVISAAAELGVKVDTGVFDLARVLKAVGPPAVRDGAWKPTGVIFPSGGRRLSVVEIRDAISRAPVKESVTRVSRGGVSVTQRTGVGGDDRVFTPEQAQAYLLRADGAVAIARATPHGAGFNDALNRACFEIAAFVPAFLTEDEAWDLACSVVEAQFPGGPDTNDVATIKSGFAQAGWSARLATEEEALNPFGQHCNVELLVAKQGGLRVARTKGADVPLVSYGPKPGARSGRTCDEVGRVEGELLDEMFSDPRYPLFGHVRHFARARRVSPVALLGTVLLRIGAAIPPYVVLPPLVGGFGSLNSFLCLVGKSGTTKGATTAASVAAVTIEMTHTARGVFTHEGSVYEAKIGSGQGFAGQFCYREKPNRVTGAPGALIRERDSVLFTCNEVADLTAKAAGASTLLSTLCELWVAEGIGSSYIDPTKRLPIEGHSYRAQFLLHAQPALMGALLVEAAAGGTPQRFVYLPVQDRFRPRSAPDAPDPMTWSMPAHVRTPDGRLVLPLCPAAIMAIDEHQALVAEDEADPLDGHLLFCQEKLAALIAFSRGFPGVGCTDWDYAGQLMALSSATRDGVLGVLREEKRENLKAQGHAQGHVEAVKDDVLEARRLSRGAERIREVIGGAPAFTLAKREIQQRCGKAWSPEAFDSMCRTGVITWKDVDTGRNQGARMKTVYGLGSGP